MNTSGGRRMWRKGVQMKNRNCKWVNSMGKSPLKCRSFSYHREMIFSGCYRCSTEFRPVNNDDGVAGSSFD